MSILLWGVFYLIIFAIWQKICSCHGYVLFYIANTNELHYDRIPVLMPDTPCAVVFSTFYTPFNRKTIIPIFNIFQMKTNKWTNNIFSIPLFKFEFTGNIGKHFVENNAPLWLYTRSFFATNVDFWLYDSAYYVWIDEIQDVIRTCNSLLRMTCMLYVPI